MKDKYDNFKALQSSEGEGIDFRRSVRRKSARWLIIAPHGGSIEPGTSEIARKIAKSNYSLYVFEGIKKSRNRRLHVTSTNFDDPALLKLLNSSTKTIVIHGCAGVERVAYVGGRDEEMKNRLITGLSEAGIQALKSNKPSLSGKEKRNICNRNSNGKGVQIELTEGLRKAMYLSLKGADKRKGTRLFRKFVSCIRTAIENKQRNKE